MKKMGNMTKRWKKMENLKKDEKKLKKMTRQSLANLLIKVTEKSQKITIKIERSTQFIKKLDCIFKIFNTKSIRVTTFQI